MRTRRPSVLIAVLDSVRRDHLSCYGHTRPTTPNIDRIATEGVRFTRASAASCWTLPSHASIFSGLYPSEHRCDLGTPGLSPEVPTIASYLRDSGYTTASISCNGFVSPLTGLTHGFDRVLDVEGLRGARNRMAGRWIRSVHRRWRHWWRPDRGARAATATARRLIREMDLKQPFLLFLNYMDCHLPYRLRLAARHRFVAPSDRKRVHSVPQDPFAVMAGRQTLSAQNLEDLRALYDGSLYYLDLQIGALYAALRAAGRLEDTVVVITSDHGESFGDHGLMDHQYGLYENLISVPMIIRGPGWSAGDVRNDLVQHTDLFPTIMDMIPGGQSPVQLTGQSLLKAPSRKASFSEYLEPNVRSIRRRFPEVDVGALDVAMRSVREGDLKLISRSDGRAELYDLSQDPQETKNLSASRPGDAVRLGSRIRERLGAWPGSKTDDRSEEGMELVRDRLQALGYL